MASDPYDSDEAFYAHIRELARKAEQVAQAEADEPADLTRPGGDRQSHAGQGHDAEPGSSSDRSISGVLARLDARKAGTSGGDAAGPSVSNRPLDAIVEDVLRPILADWLDRNLERVVRDQVDIALQAEVAARERKRSSGSS
jgi:cell pole-organizing protein PopZ